MSGYGFSKKPAFPPALILILTSFHDVKSVILFLNVPVKDIEHMQVQKEIVMTFYELPGVADKRSIGRDNDSRAILS